MLCAMGGDVCPLAIGELKLGVCLCTAGYGNSLDLGHG